VGRARRRHKAGEAGAEIRGQASAQHKRNGRRRFSAPPLPLLRGTRAAAAAEEEEEEKEEEEEEVVQAGFWEDLGLVGINI